MPVTEQSVIEFLNRFEALAEEEDFDLVRKERFYLTEIRVLSVDEVSASATYTYNWEGTMDGKAFRVQGRGTRVLVVEGGRIQIVHEHLSRFPKPAER